MFNHFTVFVTRFVLFINVVYREFSLCMKLGEVHQLQKTTPPKSPYKSNEKETVNFL